MRGIRLDTSAKARAEWSQKWWKQMDQFRPSVKQPAQQSEHVQQQMPQRSPKPWGSNWGSSQSVPHYEMHMPHESHTLQGSPERYERQRWQRREKWNPTEPRSGGWGTWKAPPVSPEMVTERQRNHNWQTGGYGDEYDSDGSTSASSDVRLKDTIVPMGWITNVPPWRTPDDVAVKQEPPTAEEEPPMKKPRTSDDVAVKQEHPKDEDQGGDFFRCSQTHDNPQAPWLTSWLVGELSCTPANMHASEPPANREVHNPQTPTDTFIIPAMPLVDETLWKTNSIGVETCVQDTDVKRVLKPPPAANGAKVIRFYSYGRSFPNAIHSIC